jgi:hypothetical protein
MRKFGHIMSTLIFSFVGVALLNNFMELDISYLFLIVHLPFLLSGVLLPDKVEPPAYGDVWHRGFFHSKIFFVILLVTMYGAYQLFLEYPKQSFLDVQMNFGSIAFFWYCGMAFHIIEDSFTKKIRFL